jgi:hypothetical protein
MIIMMISDIIMMISDIIMMIDLYVKRNGMGNEYNKAAA